MFTSNPSLFYHKYHQETSIRTACKDLFLSTIFKTFNNGNIDHWSEKIGILGKSFNELNIAINNAFKSSIDNVDTFDRNVGFWESLKNNLFLSKEQLQSKMINIDLLPEIDKTKAEKILNYIKSIEDGSNSEYNSFQALYDTGNQRKQWIAEYAQSTQGQIRSTEGVIAANKAARQSAIDYNNGLKQMTLSAKAATLGLKALTVVGNMVVMFLISKAIGTAITAIDNYIHRVEKAKEALESSKSTFNSLTTEIHSLEKELETCEQKIADITKLDGAKFAKDGELEKLKDQQKQLEVNLALTREAQYLAAKDLATKATDSYNTPVVSEFKKQNANDFNGYERAMGGQVTSAKELEYAINEYKHLNDEFDYINQQILDKEAEIGAGRKAGIYKGSHDISTSIPTITKKIGNNRRHGKLLCNKIRIIIHNPYNFFIVRTHPPQQLIS